MHLFHIIVGVALILAPWLLGFGGTVIMWINAILGVALILVSAWTLFVPQKDENIT